MKTKQCHLILAKSCGWPKAVLDKTCSFYLKGNSLMLETNVRLCSSSN